MVELKKLFGLVPSMDPDDVKDYIKSRKEGTFTLLDVRQPKEYEESHLPGAQLVPLPELDKGASQLDPDKPVFVY